MGGYGPFLALIGVLAAALAAWGGVAAYFANESRRIRRGLRHVLRDDPHALLIARGRGRGVGFNFTSNTLAVAWDSGGWCLVYRIDELMGCELIVDDRVVGRVFRREDRRPLDVLGGAEKLVRLRLVFDDPRRPDFDLDLWAPDDVKRRSTAVTSAEAVQEANRWLARTESLFRRRGPATPSTARVMAAPTPPAPLRPAPQASAPASDPSGRQELPFGAESAHPDDDIDADEEAITR